MSLGFCRRCRNTGECSSRCWLPRSFSSFLLWQHRFSSGGHGQSPGPPRIQHSRCPVYRTCDGFCVRSRSRRAPNLRLRPYHQSHDVELGARLFRHLSSLPIGYFETRRTGDSVARVRELENIRNFLTSSALTLIVDLFFTFVFLMVMYYYSPSLTWIVIGSFPFYIALSAGVTPMFHRRLEEKFNRGAENQAFLVETVSGMQTLKAMAVEPQMQRRWEEQLAAYVQSSFRVLSLGNWASQGVQLVSKVVTALTLYFGAHLVINGELTVGELIAFNMLASRVAQPVLRLAQLWQDFHQAPDFGCAAWRYSQLCSRAGL